MGLLNKLKTERLINYFFKDFVIVIFLNNPGPKKLYF